jgi:hypothetical protein
MCIMHNLAIILDNSTNIHNGGSTHVFPDFSITQRNALSGCSRCGATGLEVVVGKVPVAAASERGGHGGEISPDHERAPRGMSEWRLSASSGTSHMQRG